jgi:hypothetical protein
MAYKFQRGSAILSGALLQEGNVELASGFEVVIGNASLTEAELEMLDGITAGTVAASKAVVVDANKDVTGYRNVTGTGAITAGTSFVIGSADLNEADLEKLDGITNGTVAASKAVVVDASKDANGFRNIDGDGDLTMATITMSGFTVDADGDTALKSLAVDDGSTIGPDSVTDLITLAADGDITIKDGAYDFDIAAHDATNGLKLGGVLVTSTAAELNLVDGITAGTVAASKAVIADSNKDVSGFRNVGADGSITAGTSFIIGSADLNETDLEKLDGITNGTAAASKAVVLDANKDVAGLRDVSGRKATLSSLTQGRLVTAGASGLLEDQAALYYDDNRSGYDGYLTLSVSSSASGSAHLQDGSMQILDNAGDPVMWIYKDVAMLPAAGDTAMVAADSLYFFDATDNTIKRDSWADIRDGLVFGAVSGDATVASGGALTIAAGAVEHGMLNDNIISGQAALGGASVAQADLLMLDDGPGTVKKVTFSNFEDSIFGNISGDATVAAGGALTIAADAVEPSMINIFDDSLAATNKHILIADGTDYSSFELSGDISMTNAGVVSIAADAVHATMLNDDVISAQTELALDGLAAADELLISDGGTLKKIGVDNLFIDGPALLTEAAMVVADDYVMFLDGGATGDAKKEKWSDLVGLMAGAGLSAASGQLKVTGNDVALKADGDTLAEGYNYFADISASNVGVDLPAAPTVGDVVHVKAGNISNSRTLRVACQGSHLIDGEANVSLESPYAAISLVYVAANAWRIV